MVNITVTPNRIVGQASPMLYGQFLEHFHRQVYGGIYDPDSPFADKDGMREDVIEAMRRIKTPIIRWPGGCFVSAYHWKDGVGAQRQPYFDKAWRVEDPNTFGTDEYLTLCRKIGCEPYICTNAGTGTAEEMSDWVEYCNLPTQGKYARWRISNGHPQPYGVKYWSVGNENWGSWEMGSKTADEWKLLVREASKMIRRVDPSVELSAAALPDPSWNLNLLQNCGEYLSWISIHQYWDQIHETNDAAGYGQVMAMTNDLDSSVRRTRGMLEAFGLENKIRIAFDEWNLREWYHPKAMQFEQGLTEEDYLIPRNDNDINSLYTMADAVFTACFLNMLNRNCQSVGMACFSPTVNTRGCIFTHKNGLVLRSTYYVFDLYANLMGDQVLDSWLDDSALLTVDDVAGQSTSVESLDVVVTKHSGRTGITAAVVSKDPSKSVDLFLQGLDVDHPWCVDIHTLNGPSPDSYNDIDHTDVGIHTRTIRQWNVGQPLTVEPHSVTIIDVHE